jgi:hypothetical protein
MRQIRRAEPRKAPGEGATLRHPAPYGARLAEPNLSVTASKLAFCTLAVAILPGPTHKEQRKESIKNRERGRESFRVNKVRKTSRPFVDRRVLRADLPLLRARVKRGSAGHAHEVAPSRRHVDGLWAILVERWRDSTHDEAQAIPWKAVFMVKFHGNRGRHPT